MLPFPLYDVFLNVLLHYKISFTMAKFVGINGHKSDTGYTCLGIFGLGDKYYCPNSVLLISMVTVTDGEGSVQLTSSLR